MVEQPIMKWLKKVFENKVIRWLAGILAPVVTTVIVALVTPLGQWFVEWSTWGTITVSAKTGQDANRFRHNNLYVKVKNVNTQGERRFGLNEPTRLEPGMYHLGLEYYDGAAFHRFSDTLGTFTSDSVSTNQVTIAARGKKEVQLALSENGFLKLIVWGIYNKDNVRVKVYADGSRPVIDTAMVSMEQQLMPGRYSVRILRKESLIYVDSSLLLRQHEVTPIKLKFGVLKGKISGDENQIAVRVFSAFEIDVEGRREPVRPNGEYLIEDLIVRKANHYRIFKDGTPYDSLIFFNKDTLDFLEQSISFSK